MENVLRLIKKDKLWFELNSFIFLFKHTGYGNETLNSILLWYKEFSFIYKVLFHYHNTKNRFHFGPLCLVNVMSPIYKRISYNNDKCHALF